MVNFFMHKKRSRVVPYFLTIWKEYTRQNILYQIVKKKGASSYINYNDTSDILPSSFNS